MSGTRSSARLSNGAKPDTTPAKSPPAGIKRKVETATASPSPVARKRGRPPKQQTKLEDTLETSDEKPNDDTQSGERDRSETNATQDVDMQDEQADGAGKDGSKVAQDDPTENGDNHADAPVEPKTNTSSKDENEVAGEQTGDAVKEDKEREAKQPSNILEKGIIYFFTKGRVEVEEPEGVQDLARTYFVLRPLPAGAKLTDGTIPDSGNSRLLELPKKAFPKSHTDKFMAFVGTGKTSISDLRKSFMEGSEYETKTAGTRHQPGVTPIGEGVYAITHTGGGRGTSHLVYMLTIPAEPSKVQQDLGIREKGSFVMSIKNPASKGPANAQLPESAKFPQEMLDEFEGRSWGTTEPKHLDYDNAQILLIGEDFGEEKGLEPAPEDKRADDKETPLEELEKLEHEDGLRVEHLKGDDTIFADLEISRSEHSLLTTWPSSSN